MIAGPSEVLILADRHANPDWIAADLLAQAEHDPVAQSILVTDDAALAEAVEAAVERQLLTLPKAEIAGASWRDFGAIILVETPRCGRSARRQARARASRDRDRECRGARRREVRNAGSIFLGSHTPEAIGDYVGGPNHVLPTARSARFSSGLGVLDFMKRTSILKCSADSSAGAGPGGDRARALRGA